MVCVGKVSEIQDYFNKAAFPAIYINQKVVTTYMKMGKKIADRLADVKPGDYEIPDILGDFYNKSHENVDRWNNLSLKNVERPGDPRSYWNVSKVVYDSFKNYSDEFSDLFKGIRDKMESVRLVPERVMNSYDSISYLDLLDGEKVIHNLSRY